MKYWAKHIVLGGALVSMAACGGAQQQRQAVIEPSAQAPVQGPQVRIEGSSLVLIDDATSTPLVVFFDVDSDVVRPDLRAALDVLAVFLLHHDGLRIEVQGHADERGSDVYNEGLSLRRARAVRQYLIEQGVEARRLRASGYGEQRPVAPGDASSHRRNRRVEFVADHAPAQVSAAATLER